MSSSKFKLVEDKLNYYKELTAQTLQEEVFKQKEPRKYLYDLVPIYPNRGGKGLRPALCIATCRAYGGSTYSALRSAAAIELLHNAFLIHDDVEDESDFRRGLPTAHAAYGTPIAINLADAMFALSIYPLVANRDVLGSQVAFEVMQEVLHLDTQTAA